MPLDYACDQYCPWERSFFYRGSWCYQGSHVQPGSKIGLRTHQTRSISAPKFLDTSLLSQRPKFWYTVLHFKLHDLRTTSSSSVLTFSQVLHTQYLRHLYICARTRKLALKSSPHPTFSCLEDRNMAENITASFPGEAEQARNHSGSDSMAALSSSSYLSPEAGMSPYTSSMYSGPDDGSGQIRWQSLYPQHVPTLEEDLETKKCVLIARHTRVWGISGKTFIHSIVVQSPFIKSLLEEVLKGYPGVTITLDRLEFTQPYVDLNFTSHKPGETR